MSGLEGEGMVQGAEGFCVPRQEAQANTLENPGRGILGIEG